MFFSDKVFFENSKIFFYAMVMVFAFLVVGCSDSGRTPENQDPVVETTVISGTVSTASTGRGRFAGLRTMVVTPTLRCSEIELTVGASGSITDERVEIEAGGKSVLSDANGFYRLENVPVPQDRRLIITFSHKDGLFSSWQKAIQITEKEHNIAAILERAHIVKQEIPAHGKIESVGQGDITFPQEMAGQHTTVYFGDPTGNGAATFPGDYLAKENRDDVSLMSVSFAEITVTNSRGEKVTKLPAPATVNLRLPESFQDGTILNPVTNQPYKEGDTIAWWSYNESTALWEKSDAFPNDSQKYDADVVAGADGLYVRAQILHLSFWNGDTVLERSFINVKVVDGDGNPLSGVHIEAKGISYSGRYFTSVTEEDGWARNVYLKRSFPNQETVKIVARYGNLSFVYDVTDPLEGDVDNNYVYTPTQGGIELKNPIRVSFDGTIYGSVTDLAGNPQPQYMVSSNFGKSSITNVQGNYEMKVPLNIEIELYLAGYSKKTVTAANETPLEVNWKINQSPRVNITSPSPNQMFSPASNINIQANATDDDAVAEVEFYQGNTLLGTDTSSPYQYVWNNVAAGEYFLTAVAKDSNGIPGYSQIVRVIVNAGPTVVLSSPENGSVHNAPANILVSANALDSRNISAVYFQANGVWLASDWTSPYSYSWTNIKPGIYTITAIAKDNYGVMTTSTPVSITVNNPPSTIAITSPQNGDSFPEPANIVIASTATDPNGIARVDFYEGNNLLGSDINVPYSFTWNNVLIGNYQIKAVAVDIYGAETTSSIVNISVSNTPPTVSITSPNHGDTFSSPANITIQASALDANGTVSKVDFYEGNTLLGTDNSSPYSYAWNNVPVGTYSLKAVATDNHGATTESSSISIAVSNVGPTAQITSPANNAVFVSGSNISITANASDPNRSILKVEFYEGSTLLGTDTTSPYSHIWNNVQTGNYGLKAVATDNDGDTGNSVVVNITVHGLPSVQITNPANNAVFTAFSDIAISADALDPERSVSKVDFYQGNTFLGTDTTSPYSYTWSNVQAGNYVLKAIVTDNHGATAESTLVNILVHTIPTVSITSPVSGDQFNAPATVVISANASDPVRSITKVDFYQGNTLLGTDNSSPYSYTWSNVGIGNYALKAIATDDYGVTGESSIVNIVVKNNTAPVVSITSPVAGASFTAPVKVLIAAQATDQSSTITKVDFYEGGNLLGTDTTEPYSFLWNCSQANIYGLRAVATNSDGITGESSVVNITVLAAAQIMEGGVVSCMSIAPSNPEIIYAGTYSGVFKSINGGNTWSRMGNGITRSDISSLAVDPGNANIVYAGTELGTIFKTIDGGSTWSSLVTFQNAWEIYAIAVHPANSNIVYACTEDSGIFKSQNSGSSWQPIGNIPSITGIACIAIDPNNPNILYIGTDYQPDGSIFKSIDGGDTWTKSDNGIPQGIFINAIAISPSNSSIVYACSEDEGLFKSTNNGLTWQNININIEGGVKAIAVSPDSASLVYAAAELEKRVYKSTDGGSIWSDISHLLPERFTASFISIHPDTTDTIYIASYGYGIYKSTDNGASWSSKNSGLRAVVVEGLAINPVDPSHVYAGMWGGFSIVKTANHGASWSATNNGLAVNADMGKLAIHPSNPNIVYACTWDNESIYKSTDAGETWNLSNVGLPPDGLYTVVIDPNNPSVLYAATDSEGVYKSVNNAITWNASNNGLPKVSVLSMAIDPVNSAVVYASIESTEERMHSKNKVSRKRNPFAKDLFYGIYKSNNSGTSWDSVNNGIPQGSEISCIAIDHTVPSTLYAGIRVGSDYTENNKGILKSTNAGTSWSTSGLADKSILSLAIDPQNTTILYAGTHSGLFKSTNSGGSWDLISSVPSIPVTSIVIDAANPSNIYVGTSGGIYKVSPDIARLKRRP
ncbi:MAG: hypothetical protein HUU50_06535 [Candidatus Brocadiae bacterium]|nr:hypothetical protein [Candidatus Brocadiia bacterium]